MCGIMGMCEHCQARPKYSDGSQIHPYCSTYCAKNARRWQDVCEFCHDKSKFTDSDGKLLAYCGQKCVQAAKKDPPVNRTSVLKATGSCQYADCTESVWKNKEGEGSEYCGRKHRDLAKTACVYCRKHPIAKGQFCSRACREKASSAGPMLLELPIGHIKYDNVVKQFEAGWRHNLPCPSVRKVYVIVQPLSKMKKYEQYKSRLEQLRGFKEQSMSAGNEHRRWHGTKYTCGLGASSKQFCADNNCNLCGILKTSYSLAHVKNYSWERFGDGIYTSSTSSKSNDYVVNQAAGFKPLKPIILNKVVVGKCYKPTVNNYGWKAPPGGFDSVVADSVAHLALNYDELVVYNEDAILPAYLVMYDA